MTVPARHRGICLLTLPAAAALLFAGAPPALAQQPGAGAAGSSPPAAGQPAAPAKSKAKGEAAKAAPSVKDDGSFSLGVSIGSSLHEAGLGPEQINSARLMQGMHDGLSGKEQMSLQHQEKIRALIASVGDTNKARAAKFLAENGKKPGVTTTASGLQYQVVAEGSGASPKATDEVAVNYRGKLLDGTEFDSSYKTGAPATFQVNRVIPGWTEALQLMKPGAKWKLFIPPELAYGMSPRGPIPPGSLLIFDVELVSAKAQPPTPAPGAQPGAPEQPKR